MFRLYFLIFWNRESPFLLETDRGEAHHTQGEGSLTMKLPLLILAAMSVVAGFVPFSKFITSDGAALEATLNILFSVAPVLFAVAGILLAAWLYKTANEKPVRLAASMGGLYKSAYKKFYIDEVYLFITKRIIFNCIARPAAWIDRNIVDGLMNGIARLTASISTLIRGMQSGKIQNYTLYFFGGIAGLALMVIYLWK